MNWSVIGGVGDTVAALAVVATLVYVARQVRLANALARAEAFRTVSLRLSELTRDWASDPVFLPIARRGFIERSARLAELSPDDQARTILHVASAVRIFEMIHRQVEAGVLTADAYDMFGGIVFRAPLFGDVWDSLRGAYAEDFVRLVDDRITRQPNQRRSIDYAATSAEPVDPR